MTRRGYSERSTSPLSSSRPGMRRSTGSPARSVPVEYQTAGVEFVVQFEPGTLLRRCCRSFWGLRPTVMHHLFVFTAGLPRRRS